jgi:hypothetical protein
VKKAIHDISHKGDKELTQLSKERWESLETTLRKCYHKQERHGWHQSKQERKKHRQMASVPEVDDDLKHAPSCSNDVKFFITSQNVQLDQKHPRALDPGIKRHDNSSLDSAFGLLHLSRSMPNLNYSSSRIDGQSWRDRVTLEATLRATASNAGWQGGAMGVLDRTMEGEKYRFRPFKGLTQTQHDKSRVSMTSKYQYNKDQVLLRDLDRVSELCWHLKLPGQQGERK